MYTRLSWERVQVSSSANTERYARACEERERERAGKGCFHGRFIFSRSHLRTAGKALRERGRLKQNKICSHFELFRETNSTERERKKHKIVTFSKRRDKKIFRAK